MEKNIDEILKFEEENREKLNTIVKELMERDPNSTWNELLSYKKLSSAILKVKLSLEKIVFLELCQEEELEFFQNQYDKIKELYITVKNYFRG